MSRLRPAALALALAGAAAGARAQQAALPDCDDNRAAAPCAIAAERLPGDRYDPAPFFRAGRQPRLVLALSGGGGKGLAHIGVLKGLEAHAIRPDALTGNSGGALIGALYAAGYSPDEIESVFTRRDWNELIGALDIDRGALSEPEEYRARAARLLVRFRDGRHEPRPGLFSDHGLEAALDRHLFAAQFLSGGDFDALRVPLRVVASDLDRQEPFAPSHGDLVRLLRASMAFPGLYEPVEYEGRTLVDGMVVSNIPVAQAREFRGDLVAASNVTQPFSRAGGALGGVKLLGRSLDLMLARQQRESLALADLVFTPDTREFSRTEFNDQLPAAIQAGLAAVEAQEDALLDRFDALSGSPQLPLREVRIEGADPAAPAVAQSLRAALGERPTALRVSLALARLRNAGWAEAEAVYDPAGRVLTARLRAHAPWRRTLLTVDGVERERPAPAPAFSWQAARVELGRIRADAVDAGRAGFHFTGASFSEDDGVLRIVAGDGLSAGLALEGLAGAPARIVAARAGVRAGRPVDVEGAVGRLEALRERGVIDRWTLHPERAEGDGPSRIRVRLAARAVDGWELRGGGSYRDALGGELFAAGALRNPSGRGDRLELLAAGSRESRRGELDYRSEYPFISGPPLGFAARLTGFSDRIPRAGAGQDYPDERPWNGWEARAGFFHRSPAFGRLALSFSGGRYRAPAHAGAAEERWSRTALAAAWDFDTRDRYFVPTRGHQLRLRADASATGRDWRRGEASAESHFTLHQRLEGTLSLRLATGATAGDAPFSAAFNPGGWREAWGFIPWALAGRDYALGTMGYRIRIADFGPIRVHGEVGVSAARVGGTYADLRRGPTRYGAGADLLLINDWLGPVTIGYHDNDRRGGGFFLLIGLPLPRD